MLIRLEVIKVEKEAFDRFPLKVNDWTKNLY